MICYIIAPNIIYNPLKSSSKMKGLDCLLAMAGGAVIGAVVALMLAPCDGKEMREKVCGLMKKKGLPCSKEELDQLVEKFESE